MDVLLHRSPVIARAAARRSAVVGSSVAAMRGDHKNILKGLALGVARRGGVSVDVCAVYPTHKPFLGLSAGKKINNMLHFIIIIIIIFTMHFIA